MIKKLLLRLFGVVMILIFLAVGCFLVIRHLMQESVISSANEMIHHGGISEIREVTLGGMDQYIAIEGESLDQPICLFLHGGPGLAVPYGISSRNYKETISSHCTVVYWDQRGAGKTYSQNPVVDTLSYHQLEEDAKELISYLIETFEKDKIYLIGYTWGSVLGLRLASKIPDQLYAYVGLSQVLNPSLSEKELYHWLIEDFTTEGKNQTALALKQLGEPPYQTESSYVTFQNIINQSNAYVKWTEGLPNVDVFSWIMQVLSSPNLTLKEAYDTLIQASNETLNQSEYWKELQHVNLLEEINEIKIPVYFANGVSDYICSTSLLQTWLNDLQAPKKELLILEESAHYFSTNDENRLYEWMKDMIAIRFPQNEAIEPEEESIETIISNLLE